MNNYDNEYVTSDTVLAAWLLMNGHEPVRVITNTFPGSFVFNNHDSCLQELINAYNLGKAIGNISQFYTSYKRMLSLVKGRY